MYRPLVHLHPSRVLSSVTHANHPTHIYMADGDGPTGDTLCLYIHSQS